MPGHAKTVSVTTEYAMRPPSCSPITVISTTSVFLRMCTNTIRRHARPFARANLM